MHKNFGVTTLLLEIRRHSKKVWKEQTSYSSISVQYHREGIENGKEMLDICHKALDVTPTSNGTFGKWPMATFREKKVWTTNLDVFFVRAMSALTSGATFCNDTYQWKNVIWKQNCQAPMTTLPIKKIIWNSSDHRLQSDLFVTGQI